MADRSKIEWTDASWNPIRARNLKTGKVGWHCEHATTGCEFCYSESFNKRLGTGLPFKPGHRKDIEIFLDEQMLTQPLRWKKPRKVFVCSMTDVFADFVTDEMLDRMFAVMALAPRHTFQVLTKRASRMREYFEPTGCVNCGDGQLDGNCCDEPWVLKDGEGAAFRDALIEGAAQKIFSKLYPAMGEPSEWLAVHMPLPNVWLGVSAERQPEYDERWPELANTPAAVRFVSYEPALGPLNVQSMAITLDHPIKMFPDWIICGGESGRDARPMHPDWARSLRDQCALIGVPFFFKQWGEFAHIQTLDARNDGVSTRHWDRDLSVHRVDHGPLMAFMRRVGKTTAGRRLDGVEHNEFPIIKETINGV